MRIQKKNTLKIYFEHLNKKFTYNFYLKEQIFINTSKKLYLLQIIFMILIGNAHCTHRVNDLEYLRQNTDTIIKKYHIDTEIDEKSTSDEVDSYLNKAFINIEEKLEEIKKKLDGKTNIDLESFIINEISIAVRMGAAAVLREAITRDSIKVLLKMVKKKVVKSIEKKIITLGGKKLLKEAAKSAVKKVGLSFIPVIGPFITIVDTIYTVYEVHNFIEEALKFFNMFGEMDEIKKLFNDIENGLIEVSEAISNSSNVCLNFIQKYKAIRYEQFEFIISSLDNFINTIEIHHFDISNKKNDHYSIFVHYIFFNATNSYYSLENKDETFVNEFSSWLKKIIYELKFEQNKVCEEYGVFLRSFYNLYAEKLVEAVREYNNICYQYEDTWNDINKKINSHINVLIEKMFRLRNIDDSVKNHLSDIEKEINKNLHYFDEEFNDLLLKIKEKMSKFNEISKSIIYIIDDVLINFEKTIDEDKNNIVCFLLRLAEDLFNFADGRSDFYFGFYEETLNSDVVKRIMEILCTIQKVQEEDFSSLKYQEYNNADYYSGENKRRGENSEKKSNDGGCSPPNKDDENNNKKNSDKNDSSKNNKLAKKIYDIMKSFFKKLKIEIGSYNRIYKKRIISILKQYENEFIDENILLDIIININQCIYSSDLVMKRGMDYICILEYIFATMKIGGIVMNFNGYDLVDKDLIQRITLENENIIQNLISQFEEFVSTLSYGKDIEYRFDHPYSATYHYFMHRNYKNQELDFNEYRRVVNKTIKNVFLYLGLDDYYNFFTVNKSDIIERNDGYIIEYVSKVHYENILRVTISIIEFDPEKIIATRLVVDISKNGSVKIVTFYEECQKKK